MKSALNAEKNSLQRKWLIKIYEIRKISRIGQKEVFSREFIFTNN